jgi:hypothetical protein
MKEADRAGEHSRLRGFIPLDNRLIDFDSRPMDGAIFIILIQFI